MSRRHCILLVLLLFALCPRVYEFVLKVLGVKDEPGAYCPRVHAVEVELERAERPESARRDGGTADPTAN